LLECVPGKLEENRWYDIEVSVKGSRMECYLDGKLVESAEILHHRVPTLFTSATRDVLSGETILKVVNPGDQAERTTIDLRGVEGVEPVAKVMVISGGRADENSFEKPGAVVPVVGAVKIGGRPKFEYTFKPRSVTVLRVGTAKASEQRP
jgi:alpha-L-arabinofuranosidase